MRDLLDRVAPALPHGVVIVGSNGKGSTSALTEALLRAQGLRVGLYTSPHLFQWNERIQIDRAPIPDDALDRLLRTVVLESQTIAPDAFGQFEILTAVAAAWFQEQSVDTIVWEAGLGGRLDPTRLMPKRVAVLTQVALEHTAVLGDDLAQIALEKAAVADDAPLVVGPLPEAVLERLPGVVIAGPPVPSGLVGAHQGHNAACALKAASIFCDAELSPDPMMDVTWPGRFEQVAADVWVDVAHDQSALQAMVRTAREQLAGPIVLVIGVSLDRPAEELVPLICQLTEQPVICTAASKRGSPTRRIAAACPGDSVQIIEVGAAITEAQRRARAIGGQVLVAGGLFLAAEAIESLVNSVR